MGKERYHSPGKVNKQHNAVKNKVRFAYLQGEFDLFFVAFNAINIGCRDPPYQFVFKKIQIDRRKEKWQIAQKEEKVRITLIH